MLVNLRDELAARKPQNDRQRERAEKAERELLALQLTTSLVLAALKDIKKLIDVPGQATFEDVRLSVAITDSAIARLEAK